MGWYFYPARFCRCNCRKPGVWIEKKGLLVHAWVLMPNHIHLIVSSKPGFTFSDIIRDFKKFTSGKILKTLEDARIESRKSWMTGLFTSAGKENSRNEKYQFWQQDNYPIELTNPAMMNQRLDYLHTNPVRSGLVWEPWHYRYSSACDYMNNQKGLVEFDFIWIQLENNVVGRTGTVSLVLIKRPETSFGSRRTVGHEKAGV